MGGGPAGFPFLLGVLGWLPFALAVALGTGSLLRAVRQPGEARVYGVAAAVSFGLLLVLGRLPVGEGTYLGVVSLVTLGIGCWLGAVITARRRGLWAEPFALVAVYAIIITVN